MIMACTLLANLLYKSCCRELSHAWHHCTSQSDRHLSMRGQCQIEMAAALVVGYVRRDRSKRTVNSFNRAATKECSDRLCF